LVDVTACRSAAFSLAASAYVQSVDPKAAVESTVERAKPRAATKLVSHAGKNVSRKTRKPAQPKAFSFQNHHSNGQYIALLLNANVENLLR